MADSEHLDNFKSGPEVWNAWQERTRRASRTWAPDLRDLDLHGRDLRMFNLRGVRLSNCNLQEATLSHMDLNGAHLSGADLTGAHLGGSTFFQSLLGSAILRDANFAGADFVTTDFYRTDFRGCILGGTTFANVDLSTAIGLEEATHVAPSTLGVDTLYRSGSSIPELFLRGVGVPESLITYVPSLVGNPLDFYSCFISYNHTDKAFARRLHDTLQGRGVRCWLDEHEMLPGDNLYDAIREGIRLYDKFLLCASKASLTSWWVDNEITNVLAREQELWKARGKRVQSLIPLSLDSYLLHEWQDGKAQQVKDRVAVDFSGWERDNQKFEDEIGHLILALQPDSGGRLPPPKPKL